MQAEPNTENEYTCITQIKVTDVIDVVAYINFENIMSLETTVITTSY